MKGTEDASAAHLVSNVEIDRSPLEDRALASGAALFLIVAPAGYGKTRFARALAARLNASFPVDCRDMVGVSGSVRALLRSLQPFEGDLDDFVSRQFLALKRDGSDDDRWLDLLWEVLPHAGAGKTVWFDNAEEVADLPEAAGIVRQILCDEARSAIICTRNGLDFAQRAQSQGRSVFKVSIDDLRFTDDECAEVFPASVAADEVRRAVEFSRGWPVAALLLSRAAHEGRLAEALDSASRAGAADFNRYTINETMGALSQRAKAVLLAISMLGGASDAELDMFADHGHHVRGELEACPLVLRTADGYDAHPLASRALAQFRSDASNLLRTAASSCGAPLRSVQMFLAAGDAEGAATVLERSLSPFFHGQPSPEIADLIGSIDRDILVRFPITWSATMPLRVYTVSAADVVAEARAAWARLNDETPLPVRIGVGMVLVNHLLIYFYLPEQAFALLDELERHASQVPEDAFTPALIRMWRTYGRFLGGTAFDETQVESDMAPLRGIVPVLAAAYEVSLAAPAAFLRGDDEESRRRFADSIRLARAATSPIYIVLGLCHAAFHAWLSGDEVLFHKYLTELRSASEPSVSQGTRHFIECATGERPGSAKTSFEKPEIRAIGYMVAAAREPQGTRRLAAAQAGVDAAVTSGQNWLIALSRLCLALTDRERRDEEFSKAMQAAANVEYPEFRQRVASVVAGQIPSYWGGFRAFHDDIRTFSGLRILVLTGQISLKGHVIALSPREMELLVALALKPTGYDGKTLAAMIWPDLGERDGANAVTVNISRLRKRLEDPDVIRSGPMGYRLASDFELDLFELERHDREKVTGVLPDPHLERLASSPISELPQWILASDWFAPYAHRYQKVLAAIRARRLK